MGRAFYRPRSEASEGFVFTGVCHSVIFRGGGRWTTPKINHPPLSKVKGHNTSPPGQGQRSQHLLLGRVKGHNTSLPARVKGHNTSPPGQGQRSQHPPGTMPRQAVHIPLECILVFLMCFLREYFLYQGLNQCHNHSRNCNYRCCHHW